MAKDQLRIGIVGGGNIVRQRHMPGIQHIEGVEVVAICNRSYASTRQFAEDYNISRTVDTWQELVTMEDLDIIWIGTTPYLHCPITLAALQTGKHVFCQARMCMNLDEARQMHASAQEHPDQIVRFCPPPMGMAGDRVMRRLLQQENAVGEIRQVFLNSVNGQLLDPNLPLHWRLQTEQSGQNILTAGIYFEVLDRWLGKTTSITAVNRSWTESRPHPETQQLVPADLPESVNIIAELENGAVAAYLFNGVSGHAPGDHLAIWGTKGTLVYDFNPDEKQEKIEGGKLDDKALNPIEISDQHRRDWTVESDFIELVRGGQPDTILPDTNVALRYMAVLDAVHRAATTGQKVPVNYES
jgi:predicted dehydrogenase